MSYRKIRSGLLGKSGVSFNRLLCFWVERVGRESLLRYCQASGAVAPCFSLVNNLPHNEHPHSQHKVFCWNSIIASSLVGTRLLLSRSPKTNLPLDLAYFSHSKPLHILSKLTPSNYLDLINTFEFHNPSSQHLVCISITALMLGFMTCLPY